MRRLLFMAMLVSPSFFDGCSCSDNVSVSAPIPPQGGTNPTRDTVTNENPPPSVWTALDPQTCNDDVTAPVVKPPIFVSPIINPVGGRAYAVLVWSFCNPGRNDLPAQPNYRLLISPHDLVVQQSQNDPDCRTRPPGAAGFPSKCFPPAPGGDLSVDTDLPALPSCKCTGEIAFINVPAGQESTVANRPPTLRTNIPPGNYHFTLSNPWDVSIQDVEVVLR